MAKGPSIIFGSANVGKAYDTAEEVSDLLATLKDCGINHLDTAARYPPTSPGLSEKLLGAAKAGSKGFTIDSKVLVSGDGSGSLTDEAIGKSIANSFASLNTNKLNTLYCHAPDKQTPIEEQAAAFDRYHKEGKFSHLGVSNFTIKMMEEWFDIADKKGYIKPSFYQGQYNLVCQSFTETLFPFLRKHNVQFVAFSPLAAGFLTGKFTPNADAASLVGTRFEVADDNPFGKAARHWYDHPSMHEVNEKLKALSEETGIPMSALALRWIKYHSALTEKDFIILGASRPQQLRAAIQHISKGPLDEQIVKKLDSHWAICEEEGKKIVSF